MDEVWTWVAVVGAFALGMALTASLLLLPLGLALIVASLGTALHHFGSGLDAFADWFNEGR